MSTSGDGDSIDTSVPGTYDDPKIVHSPDPAMAPRRSSIRGRSYTAAAPWSTLASGVLDRTVFWHLMTDTPVHSKEPEVLRLMGATQGNEMFPSVLARQLAPCLGTIQPQPISVGALTPVRGAELRGRGAARRPAARTEGDAREPRGPARVPATLRNSTSNRLYDLYKNEATAAQRQYIDSLVTSHEQVRNIEQELLDALSAIKDNGPISQVLAAVTLIQMKVSPVVAIHIPFGGDNHRDIGLAAETRPDRSRRGDHRVADAATRARGARQGHLHDAQRVRPHARPRPRGRPAPQREPPGSLTIGKPFRGGVIGAVGPVASDYGALPIDSKTGAGRPDGDMSPIDTMAAFGQTVFAAVGGDP